MHLQNVSGIMVQLVLRLSTHTHAHIHTYTYVHAHLKGYEVFEFREAHYGYVEIKLLFLVENILHFINTLLFYVIKDHIS